MKKTILKKIAKQNGKLVILVDIKTINMDILIFH